MKRIFLSVILLLSTSAASTSFDHSHKAWDTLLQKFVTQDGSVRYKDWQQDQDFLKQYLSQLESVSFKEFSNWSVAKRKAFLINAYNAFTIKLILNSYPIESIKDIGSLFTSPWEKSFFSLLDGKIRSLDPIEHKWLRKMPEFKDPRIHAAVNCASISCPKLLGEAYKAKKLEAQLNQSSSDWLNDPSKNKFAPGKAKLSKIFDWFDEDFGESEQGILKFITTHAPEKRKLLGPSPDLSFLSYEWGLNEVQSK